MKAKPPLKQYIVRKFVIAKNVKEALKKEKTMIADEAWIDTDWKEDKSKEIGY